MKGKYGDSIRASTNTVYQTIKYALSPLSGSLRSQRTPGYVVNVLHESSWKNEYRRSLAKSLFTVPLTDLPAKSLLFGQYHFFSVSPFSLEPPSPSTSSPGSSSSRSPSFLSPPFPLEAQRLHADQPRPHAPPARRPPPSLRLQRRRRRLRAGLSPERRGLRLRAQRPPRRAAHHAGLAHRAGAAHHHSRARGGPAKLSRRPRERGDGAQPQPRRAAERGGSRRKVGFSGGDDMQDTPRGSAKPKSPRKNPLEKLEKLGKRRRRTRWERVFPRGRSRK